MRNDLYVGARFSPIFAQKPPKINKILTNFSTPVVSGAVCNPSPIAIPLVVIKLLLSGKNNDEKNNKK